MLCFRQRPQETAAKATGETLGSVRRLGQGGEARARWQLPRRTRPAACGTGPEEGRGNVSQEVAGSTQGAGHEPGKAAWRLEDADRGGAGSRPASPDWALQKEKRLLVTGRERRQPRTNAPPPPPEHTHPDPPPQPPTSPPAGFLPLLGRCCNGLLSSRLRRASDPAWTNRPYPIPALSLRPSVYRPRRGRSFLQLRSSC